MEQLPTLELTLVYCSPTPIGSQPLCVVSDSVIVLLHQNVGGLSYETRSELPEMIKVT
jgi:hypothetical protein